MKLSTTLSISIFIISCQIIPIFLLKNVQAQEFLITQTTAVDFFNQGIQKAEEQDREGAIDAYSKAIELNPYFAEAYYQTAKLYYKTSNLQDALADINKAISIIPDNADYYYFRIEIYDDLGQKQKAIEDYIQILKLRTFDYTNWRFMAFFEPNGFKRTRIYQEFKLDQLKKSTKNYAELIQENIDLAYLYYGGITVKSEEEYSLYRLSSQEFAKNHVEDLTKVIELNPNFANAYYYRGLMRSGKEAIADLTKAIELNHDFAEAYFFLGVEYFDNDEDEIALKNLNKALELKPDFGLAYYARGLINSHHENYQDSIQDFIQALNLDSYYSTPAKSLIEEAVKTLEKVPQTAEDYYQRGIVRHRLKDQKGALADFNQAIQISPNFAQAFLERALLNQDFDEQGTDFQQAMTLNPKFVLAQWEWLLYLIRRWSLGQLDLECKAAILLDNTLQHQPQWAKAELYFPLSFSSSTCDEQPINHSISRKSYEYYLQTIALNPRVSDFYEKNAIHYNYRRLSYPSSQFLNHYSASQLLISELKQAEKNVEKLTEIVNKNPNEIDAYYRRGTSYFQLGDFSQAMQDFSQAIKLNPQDADAYQERAFTYYQLQNYEKAIDDSDKAIELNSYLVESYLIQGISHYQLGNYLKAFESANQVIRLEPDFSSPYFVRGLARGQLGDQQGADEDFGHMKLLWPKMRDGNTGGSVLEAQSDNAELYYQKGRTLARRGNRDSAIENLEQAANLFRVSGSMERYEKAQELIRKISGEED